MVFADESAACLELTPYLVLLQEQLCRFRANFSHDFLKLLRILLGERLYQPASVTLDLVFNGLLGLVFAFDDLHLVHFDFFVLPFFFGPGFFLPPRASVNAIATACFCGRPDLTSSLILEE